MIPKTIHYCWFGRNPKPKLAEKCIKSWKKYCPDYEIIEWNEDNFDIASAPLYARQAYEAKKWAFVTDYVRLKVIYEYGGIYMDTDVEVIKSLDGFLEHSAFFGFEDGKYIATGLCFGSEKHYSLIKELMDDYMDIPFITEDGEYDLLPCPQRNYTVFQKFGVISNNQMQVIQNCVFYPKEYFCPKNLKNKAMNLTPTTHTIHHFSASWVDKATRKRIKKKRREEKIFYIVHTPNRVLKKLLGEDSYDRIKAFLKPEK